MKTFPVGTRVKILPAYSMETRTQSIHDDVTGVTGTVEAVDGADVRVKPDGSHAGGVWVRTTRIEVDAPRPRDTCPTCKRPHTLTAYEVKRGYQCRDCTARDEGNGY